MTTATDNLLKVYEQIENSRIKYGDLKMSCSKLKLSSTIYNS